MDCLTRSVSEHWCQRASGGTFSFGKQEGSASPLPGRPLLLIPRWHGCQGRRARRKRGLSLGSCGNERVSTEYLAARTDCSGQDWSLKGASHAAGPAGYLRPAARQGQLATMASTPSPTCATSSHASSPIPTATPTSFFTTTGMLTHTLNPETRHGRLLSTRPAFAFCSAPGLAPTLWKGPLLMW